MNPLESNALTLPRAIQTEKGGSGQSLENRVAFHFYDDKGNLVEVSKEGGMKTTYIWGYDKTLPIAKIENASLSQLSSALGITIDNLQNYNENNLASINALRNTMTSAMITTYTHLPLIGVSSITDPKGNVTTFSYDNYNRLQNVKDKNGKILSENKYHYQN